MRSLAYLCITGFSIATLGMAAFKQASNNAAPESNSSHILSKVLPGGGTFNHLTPLLHNLVHGGCITASISHLP